MNAQIQAEAVLTPVEWADSLASTNTELLRRVASGIDISVGHVLAARDQTAGRGRRQRAWASAAGRDLTFSFLWPDEPPTRMVSLPMAVALGIVDLLASLEIRAQTKWPNDVLVDNRKICGLLAETAADPAGRQVGVVVGLGLNINMSVTEAAAIDRPATSIRILTGAERDVKDVLTNLIPRLNARLAQWRTGGFEAIRPDWQHYAVWMDRPVALQTDAGLLNGILRGYGDAGELLLEVDGRVQSIWSAELMRPQ